MTSSRGTSTSAPFAHDARRVRREAQQLADRAGRLRARAQLEHLPEEDERDDAGRGLEVDVVYRGLRGGKEEEKNFFEG